MNVLRLATVNSCTKHLLYVDDISMNTFLAYRGAGRGLGVQRQNY